MPNTKIRQLILAARAYCESGFGSKAIGILDDALKEAPPSPEPPTVQLHCPWGESKRLYSVVLIQNYGSYADVRLDDETRQEWICAAIDAKDKSGVIDLATLTPDDDGLYPAIGWRNLTPIHPNPQAVALPRTISDCCHAATNFDRRQIEVCSRCGATGPHHESPAAAIAQAAQHLRDATNPEACNLDPDEANGAALAALEILESERLAMLISDSPCHQAPVYQSPDHAYRCATCRETAL